jgi:hypothetical protein
MALLEKQPFQTFQSFNRFATFKSFHCFIRFKSFKQFNRCALFKTFEKIKTEGELPRLGEFSKDSINDKHQPEAPIRHLRSDSGL